MKVIILTLTLVKLLLCNSISAQSQHLKDTFKIEKHNSYYPSVSIGRSFQTKEIKTGINLIISNDITKFKKNHDTFNPAYHFPKEFKMEHKRQEWTYHNSYEFLSVITLNHHFVKDNNQFINSQSIEYAIYCDNILNTMIGVGLQVKHYNFQAFSMSPQIKILPPFINFYAQRNFHQDSHFNIPKYEIGLEFNPRLLYEIGKFIKEK